MTLQEQLDAQLRTHLRRGRPLPPLMPDSMGEVELPRLAPAIPRGSTSLAMSEAATIGLIADAIRSAPMIASKAETSVTIEMQRLQPTLREIVDIVCQITGITVGEIVSPRRSQNLARPRQLAMWLAKRYTLLSLPTIGRWFGNRDHTTVMHAIRKIDEQRVASEVVAGWIVASEAALNERGFRPL